MATNYRKYAENLIGNWNTDQYNAQKDVAKNTYNTNWQKIQNDFTNYVAKVKRTLDNKRTDYYDSLSTIDKNSASRTNRLAEDLSSRGLLNSGFAEAYNQADTNAKGDSVNEALKDIVNTNVDYVDKLGTLVGSTATSENSLNKNLGATLGNLGDKEGNAKRAYNILVANLAGQAEDRALANALANARLGGNGGTTKKQQEIDDLERRMLISDTLRNEDMTDNEKVRYLAMYLDVPASLGEQALKAYKDNVEYDKLSYQIRQAQDKITRAANSVKNQTVDTEINPLYYYVNQIRERDRKRAENSNGMNISTPNNNPYVAQADTPAVTLNTRGYINAVNTLNELINQQNGLTYTDLYKLLYEDNK